MFVRKLRLKTIGTLAYQHNKRKPFDEEKDYLSFIL